MSAIIEVYGHNRPPVFAIISVCHDIVYPVIIIIQFAGTSASNHNNFNALLQYMISLWHMHDANHNLCITYLATPGFPHIIH